MRGPAMAHERPAVYASPIVSTASVIAQPTSPRATIIGVACGVGAALSWAVGLVAAKHGIAIGFEPVDLAFHRLVWGGIFLLPIVLRAGIVDLGGIGWGRGLLFAVTAGPVQAIASYTGFVFAPLGHGAMIQPGSALLCGLLLATLVLSEPISGRRLVGAGAILIGLVLLVAEAFTVIGTHAVVGDLSFVLAGLLWAAFGTLLRRSRIGGMQATAGIGALSLLVYAPLFALLFGFDRMIAAGWTENLLQMAVQGVFAGPVAIFLFSRAVIVLGAGRAASFPALVPASTLLIGFLVLGNVPSIAQFVGLAVVAVGFRLVLAR